MLSRVLSKRTKHSLLDGWLFILIYCCFFEASAGVERSELQKWLDRKIEEKQKERFLVN